MCVIEIENQTKVDIIFSSIRQQQVGFVKKISSKHSKIANLQTIKQKFARQNSKSGKSNDAARRFEIKWLVEVTAHTMSLCDEHQSQTLLLYSQRLSLPPNR